MEFNISYTVSVSFRLCLCNMVHTTEQAWQVFPNPLLPCSYSQIYPSQITCVNSIPEKQPPQVHLGLKSHSSAHKEQAVFSFWMPGHRQRQRDCDLNVQKMACLWICPLHLGSVLRVQEAKFVCPPSFHSTKEAPTSRGECSPHSAVPLEKMEHFKGFFSL